MTELAYQLKRRDFEPDVKITDMQCEVDGFYLIQDGVIEMCL